MDSIEIAFDAKIKPTKENFISACASALGVKASKIADYEIVKKSLDARGKSLLYRYKLNVSKYGQEPIERYILKEYKNVADAEPVLIVGAGPAGLFAALTLLQYGIKPIILERGKDVHSRKIDIAKLCRDNIVNKNSNFCFGEGGAGTFSDGKLYTRSTKRGDIRDILYPFVYFGADEKILIETHAHIGSDKLPKIIENIRKKILECGGEVHFNSCVKDIEKIGDKWQLKVSSLDEDYNEKTKLFEANNVILAIGHSARDIYELFYSKKWELEAKDFALGLRVEHPQYLINKLRYKNNNYDYLPAAEYSAVCNVDGRGVFSFCMCPGGILIPSVTDDNEIVLNGMSNSERSSKWANAGVVVTVNQDDASEFDEYGVLKLLKFQQSVEQSLFKHGDSTLRAPAQRMDDFVKGKISTSLPKSSYLCGVYSAPLHQLLPNFVVKSLKKAFLEFDKKMKGYYTSDALLLAVESRTSSPVRIPRDKDTLEHVSLKNLYPCGEGAGYAGGIVSSAMDGVNVAKMIAHKYFIE